MELRSDSFKHNGVIPKKYACLEQGGNNYSPHLKWNFVPNAKSYIVTFTDSNVQTGSGMWVHWILYNIPPEVTELSEMLSNTNNQLPSGIPQGLNNWNKYGYNGMCPPIGETHRYDFVVFAMDTKLDCPECTLGKLYKEKEHIIKKGILSGYYPNKN